MSKTGEVSSDPLSVRGACRAQGSELKELEASLLRQDCLATDARGSTYKASSVDTLCMPFMVMRIMLPSSKSAEVARSKPSRASCECARAEWPCLRGSLRNAVLHSKKESGQVVSHRRYILRYTASTGDHIAVSTL